MTIASEQDRHTAEGEAAEYARAGSLVVRDFIEPEAAEEVAGFVEGMPQDWWYASTFPGHDEVRTDIRGLPDNRERIEEHYAIAQRRRSEGRFAYAFFRTLRHRTGCGCPLCAVIERLQGPETLARIAALTGSPITESGGLFASEYRPTSFLDPHTDRDNGRVAMVWSLSRGWQPQNGGLLHLLDPDQRTVRRVVVPEFNSAVLFAIPVEAGTPHFVSYVPPGTPGRRLSISGWFA